MRSISKQSWSRPCSAISFGITPGRARTSLRRCGPALRGILLRTRSEENSMLKINFCETPAEERWILHGRLTDPWVHELSTRWKKNHRADVVRPCIVDLNEVTFIDKSGERLAHWCC